MHSTPAAELPRVKLKSDGLTECCAKCRFWNHGAAQQIPANGRGESPGMVAPCRRYPPTMAIINVPVGGNPRVIDPRTGFAQHAVMQQQPMPLATFTPAVDWCGEFSALPPPEN